MSTTGAESIEVDRFLELALGQEGRRLLIGYLRQLQRGEISPKMLTLYGPPCTGKTWLETLIKEQWPNAPIRTSNVSGGLGDVFMGRDVQGKLPGRAIAREHLIWLSRT
jgi:hypothetical protein